MTTWSIDYAFMIDTGDLCTREEMERVGWDKTRDTVLVSEDLATGGIRAHLVLGKRKRRLVDSRKDQGRPSKNLDTAVREWAADLMTRYAHVGDLGKTAVQLFAVQSQAETLHNSARRSCTNR